MVTALPRGLALVAALSAAACAVDPATVGCGAEPVAQLPIEMRRNVPVLSAMVDGAPAHLILDTGAEHTVLLAPFVEQIGLKRDFRHAMMVRGLGATMATALATPQTISFGGVTVNDPPVIVGYFSSVNLPGGMPDGLLGADLLAAFDVDVDVPEAKVTLYETCPGRQPPWTGPYTALPGRLIRGRFLVPLDLDGVRVPVAVDTGAEYSLVSARAASAAGVGHDELANDPATELAVVGPDEVTARVHRFRELRLGREVYAAPVLPVVPLPPRSVDGLLGMNYLRRHRVWLSYGSGAVYVAPLSQ